jgi:hypothetical protein
MLKNSKLNILKFNTQKNELKRPLSSGLFPVLAMLFIVLIASVMACGSKPAAPTEKRAGESPISLADLQSNAQKEEPLSVLECRTTGPIGKIHGARSQANTA